MTLLWPQLLWLLLLVPVLVGAYVLLLRRRKNALRYASLNLVKEAVGPGQSLRRHLPPLLLLLALITLIVAMARPTAVVTLPTDQRTIILAMDVSLSMRANDVLPNRLDAARAAAKGFIQDQPGDVRVGVVSFAGTASVVQQPTNNRGDLIAAMDSLQLDRHTAIGSGIILSLATLFPDDDAIDLEAEVLGEPDVGNGMPIDKAQNPRRGSFKPVPPGSYSSAAIILLTDGRRTTGPDPIEAAKMAADRGVRVFTVGFGTAEGGSVSIEGWSVFMRFDEETLKAIAETTRGAYFHAGTAEDLKKIYRDLNARFVMEKKDTEVTALVTAAAGVLALAAAGLSLLWFRR